MNKLNQWLTLFANLGVMAGLMFLAIELNQNTQVTIAAASEEIANQSLNFFSLGIDNQVLARALHKQSVGEELDGFEQSQISRSQYFNFRVFENAYLQYRRGFFDQTEWTKYRRIIALKLTNDPFARRMWEETADEWTAEFAAEVDDIRRSLVKASP